MVHSCDRENTCAAVATCGGHRRRLGVFITLCLVPLRPGFSLNGKLALLASWLASELLVPTCLHLSVLRLQHLWTAHSLQARVIFSLTEKALVQFEIPMTTHYFTPGL